MSYTRRNEEAINSFDYPGYTERELDDFLEWMQQFRVKSESAVNGKMVPFSYIDMHEAMVADGAMKKTMHLGKPHYGVLLEPSGDGRYRQPSKFDLFEHKLKALNALQYRRKAVEEKKVEGLEELARGMNMSHYQNSDEDYGRVTNTEGQEESQPSGGEQEGAVVVDAEELLPEEGEGGEEN